jgi:hypothetical protein
MSDRELRDKSGKLLGRIKVLSDGRLELRDQDGSLKGRFNPKNNETRDRNGNLVGKGDLLTTLLM